MTPQTAWFRSRFGPKPVIGVVHLPPLPGAPAARLSIPRVLARARDDARAYLDGGIDGLILENFGDAPFFKDRVPPHVVAVMARIASDVKELAGKRPVGANVLRNDARGALAVAVGAGLDFIRVNVLSGAALTDQGWIEGDAAALLRERRRLGHEHVRIFADYRVKHAMHLRTESPRVELEELVARAGADAVLVTGASTGRSPSADWLREVKQAARMAPVLVASGVTSENVGALAPHADGFIVGTSLKARGRTDGRVDPPRVRAMIAAARHARSESSGRAIRNT